MSEQKYKGWTIIVDCDGVLTDGKKYVDATGQRQMIAFHSRDSIAWKMLVEMGFQVIILTHSLFPGIPAYWEKYGAKVHASKIEKSNVVSHFVFDWEKTIGIGDDVTDNCYLGKCKFPYIVADAHPFYKQKGRYIYPRLDVNGGCGVLAHIQRIPKTKL